MPGESHISAIRRAALLIVLAFPIFFYIWQMGINAVNIPYSDDYDAILQFLIDFTEGGFGERLQLLFSQHGEHRIVVERIFMLLTYFVFGKANFSVLIVLGNMALLGLVFPLYFFLPRERMRLVYFLPVPFFLFHLQHWASTTFALNVLQHFFLVLLALTAFYLLSRRGTAYFWGAVFLAVLAAFTSGNGLFAFPVGIVLLLVQKRARSELLTWIGTGLMIYLLYFINYTSPQTGVFENLLAHPDKVVAAFLGNMGCFLNFERHFDPEALKSYGFLSAIFAGGIFSIGFLYLIFRRYYLKNPLVFCGLLFFFMTCAALSVSRTSLYDVEYISSVPRYKINSVLLLSLFYISALDLVHSRYKTYLFGITLFLAILYNVRSNQVHVHSLHNHTLLKIKGSWSWIHENSGRDLFYPDKDRASAILKTAERKGIYHMPDFADYYLSRSEMVEIDLIPAGDNIQFSFEIDQSAESSYVAIFDAWAFVKNESSSGSKIYLVLRAGSEYQVFKTLPQYRTDITAHFMKEREAAVNLSHSGFTWLIPKNRLDSLNYQVGLYITKKKGTRKALQFSEKTIDLNR